MVKKMGPNNFCTSGLDWMEQAMHRIAKRLIGRGSIADVRLGKQTILIEGMLLISTGVGFSVVSLAKLIGIA